MADCVDQRAGNKRKLRVTATPNVTLTLAHVPLHCRRARTVLLGPLTPDDVDAASFIRHRQGPTVVLTRGFRVCQPLPSTQGSMEQLLELLKAIAGCHGSSPCASWLVHATCGCLLVAHYPIHSFTQPTQEIQQTVGTNLCTVLYRPRGIKGGCGSRVVGSRDGVPASGGPHGAGAAARTGCLRTGDGLQGAQLPAPGARPVPLHHVPMFGHGCSVPCYSALIERVEV